MKYTRLNGMARGIAAMACLLASNTSWSVAINSSAFIDISSLSISSLSGNATLTLSPGLNSVETDIDGANDFNTDTIPLILVSDNGLFVEATASSDEEAALAQTSVGEENGLATATSQHELQYTVSGTGQLLIQASYNIDQSIFELSPNNDVAVQGFVELLDEGSGIADSLLLFNQTADAIGSPFFEAGFLGITLDVNDGDTGSLVFTALADSSVDTAGAPLPAPGAWLLILPFLGLLARRVA